MKRPYAPAEQIRDLPFDVAEWGDKPLPWPGGLFGPNGLFKDEAEFEATQTSALPRSEPKPPHRA